MRARGIGIALAALGIAFLLYALWHRTLLIVGALAIVSFILHVGLAAMILGVAGGVVRLFLPASLRERLRSRRVYFYVVVGVCLVIFAVAGRELNHRWLPSRLHPASLFVDALLLGALGWLGALLLAPAPARALGLAVSVALVTLATVGARVMTGGQVEAQTDRTSELATLPYLTWVPTGSTADTSGVVYHDRARAFPGLNLYASRNLPAAFLIDMDGRVLHEWHAPIYQKDNWGHIEILPDDGLLVTVRQHLFLRVDRDSRIRWARSMRVHHDIAAVDDTIYVLERKERIARIEGLPVPILDDCVVRMTMDGDVIDETSIFDVVRGHLARRQALRIYRWMLDPRVIRSLFPLLREEGFILDANRPVDVLHANTIEVIRQDRDDTFRRGNVIVCTRDLDRIWVIDLARRAVVWSWGEGELEWPHHPTLLANGNVLLFDNGSRRHFSRVLEIDPRANEIVWQYTAQDRSNFFSYTRGGVQRLPNGNTLITNSDSGHVFEVTADGEIVWEFLNPQVSADRTTRAAIYRMMRIVDPRRVARLEAAATD